MTSSTPRRAARSAAGPYRLARVGTVACQSPPAPIRSSSAPRAPPKAAIKGTRDDEFPSQRTGAGVETNTARVPLTRTPEEQAEEDAFLSLYGAWAPLEPQAFAHEMEGFDRPWWIVGGWAIEAATGYRREHEDTDVSILTCDVPAFVAFMKDRWHVWNNVGESYTPSATGGLRWRSREASCGFAPTQRRPGSSTSP